MSVTESLASTIATKSNELATELTQNNNPLAYPTSVAGTVASAAVASLGMLTEGTARLALRSPFSMTRAASRLEMTVRRGFRPYPYGSVQKMTELLLDKSASSAKQLLALKAFKDIECSEELNPEVEALIELIKEHQQELLESVRKDLLYAKDHDLLKKLEQFLERPIEATSVFRELLLGTLALTHHASTQEKHLHHVSVIVGKLLLSPQERRYLTEIETLVEKVVSKLYHDERAMRALDDAGDDRKGRISLYQKEPRALLFVSIYCVLEEISRSLFLHCPAENRLGRLKTAKQELSTFLGEQVLASDEYQDGKIALTKDILVYSPFDDNPAEEFFLPIQALAKELFQSTLLELHHFNLSSWKQTVTKTNCFFLALERVFLINQLS